MLHAFVSEEQRHTGAGGFVWSSTVEDNFAVMGQPVAGLLKIAGVHSECAWDCFRVRLEIHRVPQVHDGEELAGIQFFLQFHRADTGNSQFTQEFLAGDELVGDIERQGRHEQYHQSAAQLLGLLRDELNLAAEDVAEAEIRSGPKDRAQCIEGQKPAEFHVEDAGERRGHGVQARQELGNKQGFRALFFEETFGTPTQESGSREILHSQWRIRMPFFLPS